jgi:serine/threonine-protein kinase RsbW
VVSVLRDWGADARAMELAAFGVSELLSNVLKHARNPECQLGVTRSGDRVVVQVHDRSARLPKIAEPNWEAECGRGLWLLNEMADALGWTIKSEGKATWFACRLVGSEEVAA